MGGTVTGRYKIDDMPLALNERINKTKRHNPLTIIRSNYRCQKCGHKKAFIKHGLHKCTRCGACQK